MWWQQPKKHGWFTVIENHGGINGTTSTIKYSSTGSITRHAVNSSILCCEQVKGNLETLKKLYL